MPTFLGVSPTSMSVLFSIYLRFFWGEGLVFPFSVLISALQHLFGFCHSLIILRRFEVD